MIKYTDIHSHPLKEYWDDPISEIRKWFETQKLELIFFVGTEVSDFEEIKIACKEFPKQVYPVLGIHPANAEEENAISELNKAMDDSIVAIGEVGIDLYYDDNPALEKQQEIFKAQLLIAKKWNIPVILHVRDAFNEVIEIITKNEFKNLTYIFHTYSGDAEITKQLLKLKMDLYFSFSGIITFKNAFANRESLQLIPIEKIFSETDSPYLTPNPFRGKTNTSPYVEHVVAKIAEVKELEVEEVVKIIRRNIKKVFNI
ncbi:TatD DNase family protein [Mycoplasma testudineum]|uniref:TatD DNase family protein n=1 Tax=Mycoplasma testudineum TaxID=244584 RepID=A0A4R6IDZ1_9MOLU|nr:TatD family hydrolase [Mycoplasma testudineum]OYD26745.1 hydrolase TatD [Mycoplasma testudineum]TDO19881.1 TatD DNase family protein [Mycoplasma testudineum]